MAQQKQRDRLLRRASDPKFGVQGVGPLAYSTSNAGQAQGALLAEWAFNEKGWKTAYVLLDNTIAYTKSLCASLADALEGSSPATQALLGEDTFLNGDASIAAQVTRITSLPSKPDVVFFCSYAPGGPSAIRQMRAAGIEAAVLTGELHRRRLLDRHACPTSAISTSSTTVPNMATTRMPKVNAFFERFEKKYGKRRPTSPTTGCVAIPPSRPGRRQPTRRVRSTATRSRRC